jgi:hypothetical protein
MSDCRRVVVRDTPEKFDGVEKGFGFVKKGKELIQRTQCSEKRKSNPRAQPGMAVPQEKEGGRGPSAELRASKPRPYTVDADFFRLW